MREGRHEMIEILPPHRSDADGRRSIDFRFQHIKGEASRRYRTCSLNTWESPGTSTILPKIHWSG